MQMGEHFETTLDDPNYDADRATNIGRQLTLKEKITARYSFIGILQ